MARAESHLSISESFFKDLWPLILYDNICDIKQKNDAEYFVPEQRFDELWAHNLLASKSFKNYRQPIELRCKCSTEQTVEHEQKRANIEQTIKKIKADDIITLEQQINALHQQEEQRAKLIYNYINRSYPCYIEKNKHTREFHIDASMHVDAFQLQILHDIEVHQCQLMIIDMPSLMQIRQMQRWLNFQRYVLIIVVTHCAHIARQLMLCGDDVKPLLLAENFEISWQLVLTQSLNAAISYAKELKYYENCAKPFVYVFARNCLANDINTYRILRQT